MEEAASYDCGCGDCWMEKKRIRGKREWSFFFFFFLSDSLYVYILRRFRKLIITFFPVKNTSKLINQQLKNYVKIVNCQKKINYYFFYCKKYSYLKLKNEVKIVN